MGKRRRQRRWRRRLQILGAAVGLSSGTAHAAGGIISPGVLASWTFGDGGGFGLGGEASFMYYPGGSPPGVKPNSTPINYGAFLQAEKLWGEGRFFRAAAGVQGSPRALENIGAQFGVGLQNDDRGWNPQLHGGVFASGTFFGVALRGTFMGPGPQPFVQPALVFSLRMPIIYGCPEPYCVYGRPLRSADGFVLPEVTAGDARALALLGSISKVGSTKQDALAAEWLLAARGEYASIPAFLQLASDLEAVGAPKALVDRALTAAEDEVRHAQVSFQLASAFAESPIAPDAGTVFACSDPMERRAQTRDAELARIAVESWVDGCVGEGAAADRAREAAGSEDDPLIASVQSTIAREEATHAELAQQVVEWCLYEGGASVRRNLNRASEQVADESARA